MIDRLDVELTSRCILSCPGCMRTNFEKIFKKPFPKMDLDNNLLIKFLDCNAGKRIKHFHIEGNHGDAIYYPQLFDFIDHWRDSKNFTFCTAGSNRSEAWWREFGRRLLPGDEVIFSIDGLEFTNHLYRINSNWHSIIAGINILKGYNVRLTWKCIIFKTNENQLEDIRKAAQDLGVELVMEYTHRYGDDKFRPTDAAMVEKFTNSATINPKCKNYENLFISASGVITPCCMIGSYPSFFKTEFHKDRGSWSINGTNLDNFLESGVLPRFVSTVEDAPSQSHQVCQTRCSADRNYVKIFHKLK